MIPACPKNSKSEAPKHETRNKLESIQNRNPKRAVLQGVVSDFVLRICFGFRASDFGFLGKADDAILQTLALPFSLTPVDGVSIYKGRSVDHHRSSGDRIHVATDTAEFSATGSSDDGAGDACWPQRGRQRQDRRRRH